MANIFNYDYQNGLNAISAIDLFLFSLIFLCIGSFASSTIYRLSLTFSEDNQNTNLLFPRSFCPNCKTTIKLIYLMPLVGYLIQKGKCNSCKSNISIFYPLTEIFFLTIGLIAINQYGISIFLYFLIFITYLFYVLFYLDLKKFYLPLSINLLLILAGFIGNIFFNIFVDDLTYIFNLNPVQFSSIGFLIGYSSLWLVNFVFKAIYKKDGIGGGDFILFGAIGSMFGPFSLGLILFLGAITGCILFVFSNKSFKKEIPLGSCLVLGSVFYFFIKKYELFNMFIVI